MLRNIITMLCDDIDHIIYWLFETRYGWLFIGILSVIDLISDYVYIMGQ